MNRFEIEQVTGNSTQNHAQRVFAIIQRKNNVDLKATSFQNLYRIRNVFCGITPYQVRFCAAKRAKTLLFAQSHTRIMRIQN